MKFASFQKTIGTSSDQLTETVTDAKWVKIKAQKANTNDVYLGGSDVAANTGLTLDAEQEVELGSTDRGSHSINLTSIYVLGGAASQVIEVLYAT